MIRILGQPTDPERLSYVNPKLELRSKRNGEKGLFATKAIRRREIVSISAGIGVPLEFVKRLPKEIQRFCYYVENGMFYCPLTRRPSPEWFMNHSCHPNVSSPREAFTLRALRNIAAGEEVSYDYGEDYCFDRYRPFRRFRCHCGAADCRKTVRY